MANILRVDKLPINIGVHTLAKKGVYKNITPGQQVLIAKDEAQIVRVLRVAIIEWRHDLMSPEERYLCSTHLGDVDPGDIVTIITYTQW